MALQYQHDAARMACEILSGQTPLSNIEKYKIGISMLNDANDVFVRTLHSMFGRWVVDSVKSKLFHPWIVPPFAVHLQGDTHCSHAETCTGTHIGHVIDLHQAAADMGYTIVARHSIIYFVKIPNVAAPLVINI